MTLVSGFMNDFRTRFAMLLQDKRDIVRQLDGLTETWRRNSNAEIELAARDLERAADELRALKLPAPFEAPFTLLELRAAEDALTRGRPTNP